MSFDLRSIPAPREDQAPVMALTPELLAKIAVSMALIVMGLYSLSSGREVGSLRRMAVGAALVIAALLVF